MQCSLFFLATFKIKKKILQDIGFDLSKLLACDKVYFADKKQNTFVEITQSVLEDITHGKIQL